MKLVWAPFLFSLFIAVNCGSAATVSNAAPESNRFTASRGHLERRVLLTGHLAAASAQQIGVPRNPTWQTQIRWMREDGARVEAGEKVMELDNTSVVGDLEDKKAQAEKSRIELERKQADLAAQEEEKRLAVEQAEISLKEASLQADVPEEILSRHDYQQRQLDLEKAQVELKKAQANLAAFRRGALADLAVQRVQLNKSRREIANAERTISAFTISAPRSGLFLVEDHPWLGRKFQVGDMVWVGMTIATIPELASLGVEARLSDIDDGLIEVGDVGVCRLDAFPDKTFSCEVQEIGAMAQQSNPRSSRRAFRVWLNLDRVDEDVMRPGMSVKVEIPKNAAGGEALLVPREALDLSGEHPRVLLANGHETEIELGPCAAMQCVVLSGVKEGARLRRWTPAEGPP